MTALAELFDDQKIIFPAYNPKSYKETKFKIYGVIIFRFTFKLIISLEKNIRKNIVAFIYISGDVVHKINGKIFLRSRLGNH